MATMSIYFLGIAYFMSSKTGLEVCKGALFNIMYGLGRMFLKNVDNLWIKLWTRQRGVLFFFAEQ